MINEGMAKEIEGLIDKDVNKLKLAAARTTVSADLEALKLKLDLLAKGILLLKDQL